MKNSSTLGFQQDGEKDFAFANTAVFAAALSKVLEGFLI